MGYHKIHTQVTQAGHSIGRLSIQRHVAEGAPGEINPLESIAQAVDRGEEVGDDWFFDRGLDIPDGVRWVAATVTETMPDGNKSWVRIRPEDQPEDRLEIRQAKPIVVKGKRPAPTMFVKGNWVTWLASPDAQIGWWRDSDGNWHTIHDERCFDVGHQIAWAIARGDGLHGWLDVGDFMDLAAPSRHNPTTIDLHVEALNMSFERASEELARRRWLVGEEGEVVVLGGNHDIRLPKMASEKMPYLVGLKRPGEAEDEHPLLSVPYLVRARDHGVEWLSAYPSGYRALNTNLVAFHAPAYGSKALDTARKIAAKVHVSVIHGHTHRREGLAENIETIAGARTLEIWSDGTWARTDGSLPANNSAHDDYMNRVISSALPANQGLLGPNMHQGLSIIHVEQGGRDRFSVERVAIWDGWAQWRGQTFEANCDMDGNALLPEAA